MDVNAEYFPYSSTGYFSKLITDYIAGDQKVKPFYNLSPDFNGIRDAIKNRQDFPTDRTALVDHLKLQYKNIPLNDKVKHNIESLINTNTFTVCTAHQPNIFTGHLYFIYKILHTIKLADSLQAQFKEYKFVPVFYMGNEDADLEELGHIYIDGEKYEWKTKQTGAVGKMLVDDELIKLIKKFTGQVAIHPFGNKIIDHINASYTKGIPLQEATLKLVNTLFESYGLVTLIPDSASLKTAMSSMFHDDIFNNIPNKLVQETNSNLEINYKIQAQPREINLFYLADQVRNRIIKEKDSFIVENTKLTFTKQELENELIHNPDKFSPNVILRGLYQETILPNLAFIGGGGELAYWLQLSALFTNYKVPYPVLILRNSFLIIEPLLSKLQKKLSINTIDLFKNEIDLINDLVKRNSSGDLNIDHEKHHIHSIYNALKKRVETIDTSLIKHIASLEQRASEKIDALEKKMLRAEKRKFTDQQQQLHKLKSILFPHHNLQERIENIIPFYARYGDDILKALYNHSRTFDHEFCVLEFQ